MVDVQTKYKDIMKEREVKALLEANEYIRKINGIDWNEENSHCLYVHENGDECFSTCYHCLKEYGRLKVGE